MKYLKEIKKYIKNKQFITFYIKKPIILYECDLQTLYKKSKFFKSMDWNSPCFMHKCRNIFGFIKEYMIVVGNNKEYKELSSKAKKILIFHELGHIFNQNVSDETKENIADEYALKYIGKITNEEAKKIALYLSSFKNYVYHYCFIDVYNRFVR